MHAWVLMPGQLALKTEIKFLSAVHLRLKPLPASHSFFSPLSTSKLTCHFPLPRAHQEQSADSSELAYVGKAVNKVHIVFSRATSAD